MKRILLAVATPARRMIVENIGDHGRTLYETQRTLIETDARSSGCRRKLSETIGSLASACKGCKKRVESHCEPTEVKSWPPLEWPTCCGNAVSVSGNIEPARVFWRFAAAIGGLGRGAWKSAVFCAGRDYRAAFAPSHRTCAQSQTACVEAPRQSQIMCAGNRP
jgi:hypothetical protein